MFKAFLSGIVDKKNLSNTEVVVGSIDHEKLKAYADFDAAVEKVFQDNVRHAIEDFLLNELYGSKEAREEYLKAIKQFPEKKWEEYKEERYRGKRDEAELYKMDILQKYPNLNVCMDKVNNPRIEHIVEYRVYIRPPELTAKVIIDYIASETFKKLREYTSEEKEIL